MIHRSHRTDRQGILTILTFLQFLHFLRFSQFLQFSIYNFIHFIKFYNSISISNRKRTRYFTTEPQNMIQNQILLSFLILQIAYPTATPIIKYITNILSLQHLFKIDFKYTINNVIC